MTSFLNVPGLILEIILFFKVANESEVMQISHALSLAFSNHMMDDTEIARDNVNKSSGNLATFYNLKSQILDIEKCHCNASESTGKCSVPCGTGKIIHS